MLTRRFDLSGGEQIKSNKYLMKPNQVLRAQNVISETIGSFTKRKGYTQIGDQASSGNSCLMNAEFEYGSTPTRKHIAAFNTDLYVNVGGTWTAQSQSLTANKKGRGTSFVDYFFYVNLSDATRSYSGSAWSTATNVTDAPKASFVESYREKLYLAYCDVGATVYPSRVYYSSLPSATDTITWDTTNDYFSVEPQDGDHITGLAKNKTYLIIYKERSMHRYDGTFNSTSLRPISWELGAVSQESIVVIENTLFAMSLKGVTIFTGSEPKIISRPIQPIIDRINWANKADICGGVEGDHLLMYVGTLTSALPGDAGALSNVLLDYDISQNLWTHHLIPDAPKAFTNYTSSGKKLLSFGDSNGDNFTWNSGTTDDGTAIATMIEAVMWPNGPETNTTLQFLYTFGSANLNDVDIQVAVDGGSYSTAHDLAASYDKYDFGDLPDHEAREVKLKYSESGGTNQWRLDGWSIETPTATIPDVAE
jgi:hypothetical protein